MSAPVRMEDTAAYKAAIAAIEHTVRRDDINGPKAIARKVLFGRAHPLQGPLVTPLTRELASKPNPSTGIGIIKRNIVAIHRHAHRSERWQLRGALIALRWRRRFEARLAGGNVVRLADRRAA